MEKKQEQFNKKLDSFLIQGKNPAPQEARTPVFKTAFPENLTYTEIWPEFLALFSKNNPAFEKIMEEKYFSVITGERGRILILPANEDSKPEALLPDSPVPAIFNATITSATQQAIYQLWRDFCPGKLQTETGLKSEYMNTLLFAPCVFNQKQSFLFAEIAKNSQKYEEFRSEIIPFIEGLNPSALAYFFQIAGYASKQMQDFLTLLIKFWDKIKLHIFLTATFHDHERFLFAEIMNPDTYGFLSNTLKNREIMPETLHVIFTRYPDITNPCFQDLLDFVLESYPQKEVLLYKTFKQEGYDASLYTILARSPDQAAVWFDRLLRKGFLTPELLFGNANKNQNTNLFGALIQKKETSCQLADLFKTADQGDGYLKAFEAIFVNASKVNAWQIRNLCSSLEGHFLFSNFFIKSMKNCHFQPKISFDARQFFEPGLNFKGEILSPFDALHRSPFGVITLHSLFVHDILGLPEKEYWTREITGTGYAPLHVWNYTLPSLKLIKQDIINTQNPDPDLLVDRVTDGFREKLGLVLDWMDFGGIVSLSVNITTLKPFKTEGHLKEKSAFHDFRSFWQFLLSRAESRAELFWLLSKKPEVIKGIGIDALIADLENPEPDALFYPELCNNGMGRKILGLIKRHQPQLQTQLEEWLKKNPRLWERLRESSCGEAAVEARLSPQKIGRLFQCLLEMPVFDGESCVLRIALDLYLRPDCDELLEQPFILEKRPDRSPQVCLSFLNTIPEPSQTTLRAFIDPLFPSVKVFQEWKNSQNSPG